MHPVPAPGEGQALLVHPDLLAPPAGGGLAVKDRPPPAPRASGRRLRPATPPGIRESPMTARPSPDTARATRRPARPSPAMLDGLIDLLSLWIAAALVWG